MPFAQSLGRNDISRRLNVDARAFRVNRFSIVHDKMAHTCTHPSDRQVDNLPVKTLAYADLELLSHNVAVAKSDRFRISNLHLDIWNGNHALIV
jgi:hypothetical protein